MKNKTFIGIFLGIIFSVFAFVPLKEVLIRLHITDYYRSDNWQLVSKTSDPIYDKVMTLESFISNRYNNYFPFYNSINSLYYNSIINVDGILSNNIYLKDNNDKEHLFYNDKDNFYFLVNHYSKEELDTRLNNQIKFYNDINNKYPNIKLGIYLPARYDSLRDVNIKGTYDSITKFMNGLNDDIKLGIFDLNKDDYLNYYYKTDHHYNSYGAELVYKDILNMYGLSNKLNITHKDVKTPYYGSHAKSTLMTRTSDTLTAMDIDNNLKVNIEDKTFKPLEVTDRKNKFYDYYVGYFSGMFDEVIYENSTHYFRNLLIIGDSLSWQIDYLLATNFDKTYVVNTKFGKWLKKDLVLSDYIEKNNITHILFLRETKNLIFDADNFNLDKKVIR